MLKEMIKEYSKLTTSLNESKEKADQFNKEMFKSDIKDRLANKNDWEKQLDELACMEKTVKYKQEYLYILQYNIFNTFIVENMEAIREIINKYAEKPIGEKRKSNLYDELYNLIPKEFSYTIGVHVIYRTFGGIEIYFDYKHNKHWVWIINSDSNTYSELTEEKAAEIIDNANRKIVNDIDKYIADTYEKVAILNEKIEEAEKLYSEIRDATSELNLWSCDTIIKKYRI